MNKVYHWQNVIIHARFLTRRTRVG